MNVGSTFWGSVECEQHVHPQLTPAEGEGPSGVGGRGCRAELYILLPNWLEGSAARERCTNNMHRQRQLQRRKSLMTAQAYSLLSQAAPALAPGVAHQYGEAPCTSPNKPSMDSSMPLPALLTPAPPAAGALAASSRQSAT